MDRAYNAVVRAYERLANPTIVVVFLLFALFFLLYLFPRSTHSFTARGDPIHWQMQLAHQKDAWVRYVEHWGEHIGSIESAVQEYRMHLLRLDVVFPVIYVVLLMSAIARLTKELDKGPSKWVLMVFLLPVVGGIFDLAENYMHITVLQGATSVQDLYGIPADSIRLSFIFTMSKVSLVVLPLLVAIAISLYRRFYKMDRQTKDCKDPDDLKDLKEGYTKDLRTVIEKEKEYISIRREKATKEFLVTELPTLKARFARMDEEKLDEEEREELKEKIRLIEEWLRKEKALYESRVKRRALENRLQDIEKESKHISAQRVRATKLVLDKELERRQGEILEIEKWLSIVENIVKEVDEGKQEKYWKEGQDLPDRWEDRIRAFLFVQLSEELPRLKAELARADGEKLNEEEREELEEKIRGIEEWLKKKKALYQEKLNRGAMEEQLKEIEKESNYISAQRVRAMKRFLDKELKGKEEGIQEIEEWLQIIDYFTKETDEGEHERLLNEFREKQKVIADPFGQREKAVRRSLFRQLSELSTKSAEEDGEKQKELEKHVQEIKAWLETKRGLDQNAEQRKELRKQLKDCFKQTEYLLFPDRTIAERPPIGLAFSGGGIRSAIFNLGLVQGLAKYGFLPWVDYLTSVSGGGLTAACMTTLLSMDKKDQSKNREYYHFNTQWDYFPFNPELKAFDGQGVVHREKPTGEVGPPLATGTNKQLEYLRDKGNFLIPRMGWLTRDMLRAIGALLVRTVYTLVIFLSVLVAFSAFHYGVTAALTPSIRENVDLNALDIAALIPTTIYLRTTLAVGFLFSLFIGVVLTQLYTDDPTIKYKLKPWKSPEEDVALKTYLAISNTRVFALVCSLGLLALTLWLWIGRFQTWSQSATDLRDFYWAWGLLLIPLAFAAGWFVLRYTRDYRWAKRALPEQLRIDHLVAYAVAGLFVWVMILSIAWLRFQYSGNSDLQIFWIWLPALFTLGSLIGLAVFRIVPHRRPVYVEKGKRYDVESVGWLGQRYFKILGIEPVRCYQPVSSGGVRYTKNRWSNPEFRSIFWTLQGLVLHGLMAFLVLAFLALPHYFTVAKDTDSNIVVPLATAIVSTGWAALLSYVNNRRADFEGQNLIARIIALPGGIRNYVLGLLVILLNLSIIFLIESRIDGMSVAQACKVGIGAFGFLYVLGRFADFNHLTPHYFFRDRMAEVFMRTEVTTETGQVEVVRDHRDDKLWWRPPKGCSAPYLIVLTTLNLPGSWDLSLKDRKSQPFILSKYYCGSDITGYVDTREYRRGVTTYSRAIALSGAAISPGLGYHTFFAQAFMTTLLNVRLGLWMINPEQYRLDVLCKYAKPHQKERRVFWPIYLSDEARGRISERRALVNLTDGEHTGDGIGLYPLFQRRCKVIIAGDASGDPAGQCIGLFCVIRQVKVDMGIEVDINIDGTRPAEYDREKNVAEPSQRHFAVGKITYPEAVDAEGRQLPKTDGWLLYFKAAVTKDDPGPILSYWETHKMDFPVPPTADQFFDEEQWELQRWLGEFTIEHTLKELKHYYDRNIEEKEENSGGEQAEIARLAMRRDLLKELLENRKIDFASLSKYPGILEEFMNALYTISKGLDDRSEE